MFLYFPLATFSPCQFVFSSHLIKWNEIFIEWSPAVWSGVAGGVYLRAWLPVAVPRWACHRSTFASLPSLDFQTGSSGWCGCMRQEGKEKWQQIFPQDQTNSLFCCLYFVSFQGRAQVLRKNDYLSEKHPHAYRHIARPVMLRCISEYCNIVA